MFKFLKFLKIKKKIPDCKLEQALKLGLITKEEVLKLRLERADQDYKNFIKKGQKKGPKK